ncbi:hypothetical protein BDY17DRAFT_291776 [Neohortaea acidophila]|uniref:Ribosomal protein S8 n=1 Tax=Neohortaea acidophila TaxID=245834 RepID=A0A6A6Q262_9PEZI|nr:uncharacterized protein BDY17DRAFT_291776 [Neohortaea acidophila]KAF2486608.1 hypothetical protein BDY17DRAFT_291776 [Neohortaea acidophila]
MSLVNLSHVCSHLQNASLARLGLTSIPYTRLHLSLSLLLLKQGFFSSVKLAGPAPPASSFPTGTPDHNFITAHPPSERHQHTPQAALQWITNQGPAGTAEGLREDGFGDSAIAYAMEKRLKNRAQLEKEGWNDAVADFLLKNSSKDAQQMREAGHSEEAIAIMELYRPQVKERTELVRRWYGDREEFERSEAEAETAGTRAARPYDATLRRRLYEQVSLLDFDVQTLRHFAGDSRYLTWRELALEGVDVDAMGLTIPGQALEPPAPKSAADPWQLEEEGVVTQANRASRRLWLGLKYYDGLPVLQHAKMVSKPKKRINMSPGYLEKLVRGRNAGEVRPLTQVGEIMAVKTDLGVLEIRECVERKMGGQILCRVW